MKSNHLLATLLITAVAATHSPAANADYTIKCESHKDRYKTCSLRESGYVRIERQISKASCRKGRDWDFNRREIWVDNNCKAKFTVERKYNNYNYYNDNRKRKHKSDNDAGKAIAAVAGIAILGALLNGKDSDNYSTKYDSENYYGSRHSSYVPGWAVGKFRGYNNEYGVEVSMKIDSDGRISAVTNGESIYGYYNDSGVHFGGMTFDISRTPQGFETRQHGDYRNTVRYHRVR